MKAYFKHNYFGKLFYYSPLKNSYAGKREQQHALYEELGDVLEPDDN